MWDSTSEAVIFMRGNVYIVGGSRYIAAPRAMDNDNFSGDSRVAETPQGRHRFYFFHCSHSDMRHFAALLADDASEDYISIAVSVRAEEWDGCLHASYIPKTLLGTSQSGSSCPQH